MSLLDNICQLGFHLLRIFPHWEWSEARGYILLSPLLFNVYMDNISLHLHMHPIGCSVKWYCGKSHVI